MTPRSGAASSDSAGHRAGSSGLAEYVVAATLARTVDGGGVVAVVLLVTTSGGPGWLAGLLGAAITFPHLLGPFIARIVDVAGDGRTILAIACVVHGSALAIAALLYPVSWTIVPMAFLVLSGLVGPLLTGGISSQLPAIAGPDRTAQRRAQGWDVATYGIGGTLGPTIVATLSAWANPTIATLVLAGGTVLAAVFVRLLPPSTPASSPDDVPHPFKTLGIIARTGPLRRTLYLTMTVALAVAVVPITAVASTGVFRIDPAFAGLLTAAYGLGSLAGSLAVMIRPLRGDADAAMPLLAGAVAIALVFVAVAPSAWLAAAAYLLAGILNSFFFAATLASRSEYAPPAARGQVFVWVGALKITAGSAGTAAAGMVIATSAHLPAWVGAGLVAMAVVVAWTDRMHRPTQRTD